MEVPETARRFWDAFQASVPYDASPRFHEAFHFDDNERSADALGALVLSGRKQATAGLWWTHEATGKPLPVIGALSVVTDWRGTPLWRDSRWRFFSRECARIGRQPELGMPVVCERFEVVYPR